MSSAPAEPDELARFREEWKKEVKQKLTTTGTSSSAPPPADTSTLSPTTTNAEPNKDIRGSEGGSSNSVKEKRTSYEFKDIAQGRELTHAKDLATARPPVVERKPEVNRNKHLQNALVMYTEAAEAEQDGDFDRALSLYRASFRLDPNVDKAYHRSLTLAPSAGPVAPTTKAPTAKVAGPVAQRNESSAVYLPDALRDLLSTFSSGQIAFQPDNDNAPAPFAFLADELVVFILWELARVKDVVSIERFGAICRKARVVSLDAAIWRQLVNITYVKPQIAEDDVLPEICDQYDQNYRNMYISHPRVRMDGVYISVCHYVRPGYNENPWVSVTHLITYHRYLRFLPDGTVLSLLANDEVPPSQVVHQLKLSLRKKGHYVGRWRLEGTTVLIDDLLDSEGLFVRYAFAMALELKSKPMGRWNRLAFLGYESVNLSTGEAQPLALKHERPFTFSKVRSYSA